MGKEEALRMNGEIKRVLGKMKFTVELENGHEILAHVAGKIRKHKIRLLPGDNVAVEISPYDLSKGRIVYRNRRVEAD